MPTYAYDLEVYPNLFVACFINAYDKSDRHYFFAYKERGSTIDGLKAFLAQDDLTLVGYNNRSYDDVILKALLDGQIKSTSDAFFLNEKIISNEYDDQYWDIYNLDFWDESIDIMVLHRFREMGVRLKFLGVVTKHYLIQDLPLPPGTIIENKDFDTVIEYCFNDVEITLNVFERSKEELEVREKLNELFEVNVTTESRSGAAQKIVLERYSAETGTPVYRLKKQQTVRHAINAAECIGPNLILLTPPLKALRRTIETLVLKENVNTRQFNIFYDGDGNIQSQQTENKFLVTLKKNFKYSTSLIFKGTRYDLGVGGLHSKDSPGVYKTDKEYTLMLADVSSYYPSLQLANNIYPRHMGVAYLNILRQLMNERLAAKELSKTDPTAELAAYALKIVINSIFGRLGDRFSPLLDAKAMTTVTLSGQLYLLDLIEKISLALEKTKIISANTDGVWVLVHKSEIEEFKKVGDGWANRIGLELDYEEYLELYQRDVNNYLAIDIECKPKPKGAFVPGEEKDGRWIRPLDKGYNMPIVPIAIYNYLVNGIDPKDTVMNHKDIHDFVISQKVGKQFSTVNYGANGLEYLQKTNRFIVTTSGKSLVKRRIETGTLENIVSGEFTQVVNLIESLNPKDYPLKYSYYLNAIYKILKLLFPPQENLLGMT